MLLPVFLRRHAILSFEFSVKTGVIGKSELLADLSDGLVSKDGVFAGIQPFSCDVLMRRHSYLIFKQMRNIIFVQEKQVGQPFQGQVFFQMGGDKIADCLVNLLLAFRHLLVILQIGRASCRERV